MQKIKYISLIVIFLKNISCSGIFLKRHYFRGYTFISAECNKIRYNDDVTYSCKNKFIGEQSKHNSILNENLDNGDKWMNGIYYYDSADKQLNVHINKIKLNPFLKTKTKKSDFIIKRNENDSSGNKSILYKNVKHNFYFFTVSFLLYLLLYFTTMNFFSFLLYILIILFLIVILANFIINIVKYYNKLKDIEIEKKFFPRYIIFNLLMLFLLILIINGLYFGFSIFGYLYFF